MWGEESFQQMVPEQSGILMGKNEASTPYHVKKNIKRLIDGDGRPQAIKLLEENMGANLHNLK